MRTLLLIFLISSTSIAADDATKVRGFEPDDQEKPEPTQGFGEGKSAEKPREVDEAARRYMDRARRWSEGYMRRYDRNKDGKLQKDEWEQMRGEPHKADYDKDGIVTLDELTKRLAENMARRRNDDDDDDDRRRGRRRDDRERSRDRDRDDDDRDRRRDADRREEKDGDVRRSYRFTSAAERLPEDLPSWFSDRDADRDGQVAMHEYSRSWSDRTAREFAEKDRDGDGFISPSEAQD